MGVCRCVSARGKFIHAKHRRTTRVSSTLISPGYLLSHLATDAAATAAVAAAAAVVADGLGHVKRD